MGHRIQDLRNARGWTQEELGREVGLDRSRISRYERGRLSASGLTVKRLAEALGVTTDQLLGVPPLRPPRLGDALGERSTQLDLVPLPHRESLLQLIDSYLETHRISLAEIARSLGRSPLPRR
ncbi:MAG TPA: helix-turn-helix transcriptional regulator [Thermoanaerobaculia bacterium]|nr:helix-turn-helix transcriptional regulator [Thermoanaerobaculia bacterium]